MRYLISWVVVGVWAVAGVALADDPDARLAELDARIAASPAGVELLMQRADLLVQEGLTDRAVEDLRLIESLAPDETRLLLLRGLVAYGRGDLARAEADLEAYVSRTGGSARACFLLGQAYEQRDREADALRSYDMALRHGDDVEVYLARGRLLEGLGRLAEAAQSYEMALQGDAASTALRVRLVEVERRLGRYDHALAHVDAAMRHARVDTRWLLRRAQILEDAGRRAEARRARVEALTEAERLLTRRSSPAALAARGEALLALGRADDAARDLAQAVRRAPSLTHARQLLAEARRTMATGEVGR